jgi:transcriptional regulator with XRE-family HTH domain
MDGRGPFGSRLRQYRAAAGLSQEELAERAGLSKRGISYLEHGQRRSPHPATVRRLAEALELNDAERAAWLANPRASAAADPYAALEPPASNRRFANLRPDLTSFVGRVNELDRLADQVGSVRLLTLVGPGGVGKTRLATRLAERYLSGGCLVEVANLSEAGLVPNVMASARESPSARARP